MLGQFPHTAKLTIAVDTPPGKLKIVLSYVALVPTVSINIIALSRATANDIHFNSGRNLLYYLTTGKTVCYTKRLEGHWVLMHKEPTNSLNSTKSAFLTFKKYQPISAPDPPTSAPFKPITAPVATTATSPESPNTSQPAAYSKTC